MKEDTGAWRTKGWSLQDHCSFSVWSSCDQLHQDLLLLSFLHPDGDEHQVQRSDCQIRSFSCRTSFYASVTLASSLNETSLKTPHKMAAVRRAADWSVHGEQETPVWFLLVSICVVSAGRSVEGSGRRVGEMASCTRHTCDFLCDAPSGPLWF